MAEWIIAVAAVITILCTIYVGTKSSSKSEGKSEGMDKEWKRAVDERLNRHDNDHKNHYNHAADDDAHWTARERDDLSDWKKEFSKTQAEILKEVKDLGQRMYGK